MKLLRVGPRGRERPAVLGPDGVARDLSGLTPDIDGAFLARGGLDEISEALPGLPVLATDGLRIGAPVARPGKIVCIGLNYADHAAETGAEIPPEPVVFMKASNTLCGPGDEVPIPRDSVKTDYEVELAVVLKGTARYLDSPDDAADLIAGYAISDDVSEREYQLERGGTWDKGKSCEDFNPCGPWLVTPDEVGDPQNLGLRLWVNGELRQESGTRNMIFGVHHIIWYLSRFMVLEPGDVINTGTPHGVALALPGTPYLRPGDVVEAEIDGLGRQKHTFGDPR